MRVRTRIKAYLLSVSINTYVINNVMRNSGTTVHTSAIPVAHTAMPAMMVTGSVSALPAIRLLRREGSI